METVRKGRFGQKKITITDVALALNVSKTTVSRAISGKGRISDETRRRVIEYIEENDYKPNVIAKGLAVQKTFNIAFVIPGDCNLVDMPFFQNSMQGICEEASKNDYDVMIVTISRDNMCNLERMISNNKVDGVILSRSMVKDKAVEFLEEQKIPFVLMGTSNEKRIIQVDNDNRSGCCELVGRMLKSGVKRIGLIGGNRNYVVNRTRMQGYQEAFKECRVQMNPSLVFENCDKPEKIEFAVNKLLEIGTQSIVCMDDAICSIVLHVLSARNIAVPDRIQVASFYDSMLLRNSNQEITTLMFDDKALGILTCQVLLKYMSGEDVKKRTLLGYEIVGRNPACKGW